MNPLLDDLRARGLIQNSTDLEELSVRMDEGAIRLYYGCDPTAPSLHAGNLIGLLVLRRFAEAGHRPVALVGGATGMVGDPGGRSQERNLLDEATLTANVAGIRAQVEAVVGSVAEVVDNREWTEGIGVLEFLRDVGKHVTVNQMLARETIKARIDSEHGISYTEFSYMLLQANDYHHLHGSLDVELQIGGSDQWGNIVGGVDLVRRRSGATVHALTWPLMTRADGAKFGKSADGAIWLSAEDTTPYAFFQYWMNVDDRDVERFLLQLTLLEVREIRDLVAVHLDNPQERRAQRRLATEVTTLVHGADAAAGAEEASAVLFGADPTAASAAAFGVIGGEVPVVGPPDLDEAPAPGLSEELDPVPTLVAAGLASSRSEARRFIADGAVRVTGRRLAAGDAVTAEDLRHGRFVLLARGRKRFALLDLEKSSERS